jgi:hypothetical protein
MLANDKPGLGEFPPCPLIDPRSFANHNDLFTCEGFLKSMWPICAILWASLYTLLGLGLGLVGLCTGGRARRRGRVVEFYGGAVAWLLTHRPAGGYTLAITFGHTVLGQSDTALDIVRAHELVHVRQYECWGPFFGPAYLGCTLLLWLGGRRPYLDNPFELAARKKTGEA